MAENIRPHYGKRVRADHDALWSVSRWILPTDLSSVLWRGSISRSYRLLTPPGQFRFAHGLPSEISGSTVAPPVDKYTASFQSTMRSLKLQEAVRGRAEGFQ